MARRIGTVALWCLAILPGLGPAAAGSFDGAYQRETLAMPRLRSCAEHGPGFAAVAGSDTCVRIGARVRAEAGTRGRGNRAPVAASGRLAVDARTQTDYGPVRTFVRLKTGQH